MSIWETNGGLYMGYLQEKLGVKPRLDYELAYTGDRQYFQTGPNGSGKTRSFALVNACRLLNWTVVLLDTKGVLCWMTREWRKAHGCKEFIFNPANMLGLGTMTHNPVAALDPKSDYFIDDAMEHSETVVPVEGVHERHWPESGQEVFAGLEMYVRAVLNGTMGDCRALLGQADPEFRRMIKLKLLYKDKEYPSIKDAADALDLEEMYHKLAQFEEMRPEDRELHSILSTTRTQTRSFDSRLLKKVMSGDAVDFSVLKEKPCTVYLIVPPRRLQTYAKWLRLMLASILQALMQDVRPAKVPVLILIDEAYPILYGGFPILENNYAQLREFGVKIGLMFQSLAQPIMLWGEKGFETFIGNAVFQNFAPQDMVTSRYLSDMSGETTGYSRGGSGNTGFGGGNASIGQSGSYNAMARPLLLPHEVREMDPGWTLAWSHQWKGTALSYLPWPGNLKWMREIVKLDPVA